MKMKKTNPLANRTLIVFTILFSICCLKLCAEDISPAQAQVNREKFVAESKKYVGCPYVYGATGPDSFDCSGLIYYVANQALGLQLPRTSKALYSFCKVVPKEKMEEGDLLFFKTNNTASITHVGIYIGGSQFISAISDGPNSGVIISSLDQEYWKPKYVGCGQFLASGKDKSSSVKRNFDDEQNFNSSNSKTAKKSAQKSNTNFAGSSFYNPDVNFLDSLTFDGIVACGWSLFSPNEFMLKWRGLNFETNVRISKWVLEPGFGFGIRYNYGIDVVQIPLIFSATLNDYVRFYAGPVITFGNPKMISTEKEISSSFFPGILGVTFSTPSFSINKAKVQFIQDVSYTVFNNPDNAALSFIESASAGIVMFTGIKVTLGMGAFK
ncbi:MAG: C40 family peptidase [Spirochaetia bacterium]|nr:C40 family peptidase [Spirochaetia bacterium]